MQRPSSSAAVLAPLAAGPDAELAAPAEPAPDSQPFLGLTVRF